MGGDVKVLVVGENPDQVRRWSTWLEHAGWTAVMCPGPRLTWGCPRLDGEPCPRRELADAAVVALPVDEWGEERLCTKVPDDGTTVFLRDADVSLRVREKGIEVSERAPGVLIEVVRDALRRVHDREGRRRHLRGRTRGTSVVRDDLRRVSGNQLRGVWHFSFTVRDLDVSIAFYRDLLGFELVHIQTQDNAYTRRLVGFPDAVLRVAQLAVPGQPRGISTHDLELVEYLQPKGIGGPGRICDPGAAHLAVTVEDACGSRRCNRCGSGVIGRQVRTTWAGSSQAGRRIGVSVPHRTGGPAETGPSSLLGARSVA